jgi:hypothetical protein
MPGADTDGARTSERPPQVRLFRWQKPLNARVSSPRIRPVRGVAWSGTVPCLLLGRSLESHGWLKVSVGAQKTRAGKTPVQARQRVGLTRWAAARSAQLASRRSCPPASCGRFRRSSRALFKKPMSYAAFIEHRAHPLPSVRTLAPN